MTHDTTEIVKDTTGIVSLVVGVGTWTLEKLQLMSINDFLTGVSISVGIIWAIFKVIDTRLSIKIKKQELKNNKGK